MRSLSYIASAIPAGANTNIQFNNNGVLGGNDNLTWNNTTPTLALKGIFNSNGMTVFSSTSLSTAVGNIAGDTGNNLICRQNAINGNAYYGTQNISNTSGFIYFQTAGQNRAFVTGAGLFGINTSSPGAQLGILSNTAATTGLIVKGASSQSANLQEWKNVSDTVLAAIRADGSIKPASIADSSAANDSIYYSTTANKLVYKDSSGTVNALY